MVHCRPRHVPGRHQLRIWHGLVREAGPGSPGLHVLDAEPGVLVSYQTRCMGRAVDVSGRPDTAG